MSFMGSLGDQLPLGTDTSHWVTETGTSSGHIEAPFGLRFATGLAAASGIEYSGVRYDHRLQLSVTHDGQAWVPLITVDSPLTVESTGELGGPNYDEIFDKN